MKMLTITRARGFVQLTAKGRHRLVPAMALDMAVKLVHYAVRAAREPAVYCDGVRFGDQLEKTVDQIDDIYRNWRSMLAQRGLTQLN